MEVTSAEIRRLVDRPVGKHPVTSVFLNTDGARYPRTADYEARLEGLLRGVCGDAERLDVRRREAVHADAQAIRRWVRHDFERNDVRGLALFACGGEIFERCEVALPVRNIARVNDRPYVVPLEALLGRSDHIALVVIERDKARILRSRLGKVWEYEGVASDVHRQHEQGGWSQARFQRGIAHEVLHHKKDTVEVLLELHKQEPIDALVLGGPHAEAVEFNKLLHPYLRAVRHGEPVHVALNAAPHELAKLLNDVEQELVSARRRELLARLGAAKGQGEKAAWGVRHVLEAVNTKRVGVLFVVEGAGVPGFRSASGALALHEADAAAYGEPVEPVDDLVDEIIEQAVRADAQVELFRDGSRLDGHPVAALLRF